MRFTVLISGLALSISIAPNATAAFTTYAIVDTGQQGCYGNSKSISCPKDGSKFDGQDAQYHGNQPSYRNNNDGTISDNVTGLMWQKTPSTTKTSFAGAKQAAANFELAGYDDWRLPTIKELYSLIDFRGQTGRAVSSSTPYINTDYFDFYYGNESKGERLIDAQYWSSTEYTGTTMGGTPTTFGVNFADGRIKGYPSISRSSRDKRYVRYVRGNPDYGVNNYVDNKDGTVTDKSTGLTWLQADSGKELNWQQALSYAETTSFAGHDDWRLPNAKELQSIIDYSKSNQAKHTSEQGPSIDPIFKMTDTDGWYWSSTTHLENGRASQAVYLAFGQAWGYMSLRGSTKKKMDVHGAGAQRSDPKSGDPNSFSTGRGPQGDEVRIYNFVRLVRGGEATKSNISDKSSGTYGKKAEKAAIITSTIKMGGPNNNMNSQSMRPKGSQSPSHTQQNQQTRQRPPQHGSFVERLDKNGDGKVSKDEFDGPPHHFDQFDTNGDGYLSEEEAPKGPPPMPGNQ